MNILFLFTLLIIVLLFTYRAFGISHKMLALIIGVLFLLYFTYYQYNEKMNTNNFEDEKLNNCFVNPNKDTFVDTEKQDIIDNFKRLNKNIN